MVEMACLYLLAALRQQHQHEIIVAGDDAPHLEAIHQEQSHGGMLPGDCPQHGILQVGDF